MPKAVPDSLTEEVWNRIGQELISEPSVRHRLQSQAFEMVTLGRAYAVLQAKADSLSPADLDTLHSELDRDIYSAVAEVCTRPRART